MSFTHDLETNDLALRSQALTARVRRRWIPGLSRRLARTMVLSRLAGIEHGQLRLRICIDDRDRQAAREEICFGSPATDGLTAGVEILDRRFWTAMLTRGGLGAAEAYAEGWWTTQDLTQVVRLFVRNRHVLTRLDGGWARLARPFTRLYHALRRNSLSGSRRNIQAHYDLSNGFFERFLDPTMTYSSAVFEEEDMDLEQAQLAKIDRLCDSLGLGPEHHLLEIGTGWGALAIRAARKYGCRVTTTTISEQQHAYVAKRLREEGLEDKVKLLLRDYRDLEGRFDRVVSVEMIEAVGAEYLEAYFASIGRLLVPDGLAALQAITIQDQDYERARRHVDFIKRYIFPGSCIPSVTAITQAMTASSDLRLRRLEDLTPHYARTLAIWRERLLEQGLDAARRGLDARFLRTWEYYFSYCEGGFRERHIGLVHLLLARPLSLQDAPLGARTVR